MIVGAGPNFMSQVMREWLKNQIEVQKWKEKSIMLMKLARLVGKAFLTLDQELMYSLARSPKRELLISFCATAKGELEISTINL